MSSLVIAGAGQMGRRALMLINRAHVEVLGFADNDTALWGGAVEGLPVYPMEQVPALPADAVLIAVAQEGRTRAIAGQLRRIGYRGEIRTLCDYRREIDLRAAMLRGIADRIQTVPGAVAELGVYQGSFAGQLNALFPERTLYLFDTFTGFDPRDVRAERDGGFSAAAPGDFSDTSEAQVLARLCAPGQAVLCKGYFPDTAAQISDVFALVSLDADLYIPTLAGLEWFYPRMAPGGVILLHDYENRRFGGVHAAVETYEARYGRLLLIPVGDLHGSAVLIKP